MTQWGKFSRRNYFVHSTLTAMDLTYAGHHPDQCFCWGSTKLAQLSGGPFKAIKPTEDLARKENSRRKLSRQRRRKEIFFSYSFLFPTLKTLPKAQLMWLISTFYWEPIFTTQKSILWRNPPQADFHAAFFDICHGTQSLEPGNQLMCFWHFKLKDWIFNYSNFSLQN